MRLNMIVEGQTEREFVRAVLGPHLVTYSVFANARLVETSRRHGTPFRGGSVGFQKAKRDVQRWMSEDRGDDVRFTTMLDLYALPRDFPDYEMARRMTPRERVCALEQAFADDIGDRRFIPYIQLHEFEALVLADPAKLRDLFPERENEICRLMSQLAHFDSPEDVDDGPNTAPSKRVSAAIPSYEGQKVAIGPLVAEAIGLSAIRAKCRHFDQWLTRLESLGASPDTPRAG